MPRDARRQNARLSLPLAAILAAASACSPVDVPLIPLVNAPDAAPEAIETGGIPAGDAAAPPTGSDAAQAPSAADDAAPEREAPAAAQAGVGPQGRLRSVRRRGPADAAVDARSDATAWDAAPPAQDAAPSAAADLAVSAETAGGSNIAADRAPAAAPPPLLTPYATRPEATPPEATRPEATPAASATPTPAPFESAAAPAPNPASPSIVGGALPAAPERGAASASLVAGLANDPALMRTRRPTSSLAPTLDASAAEPLARDLASEPPVAAP